MKEIKGSLFRVRSTTDAWLVETCEEKYLEELSEFCAEKTVTGNIITSITQIFPQHSSTPRIAVLNTPEFKAAKKAARMNKEHPQKVLNCILIRERNISGEHDVWADEYYIPITDNEMSEDAEVILRRRISNALQSAWGWKQICASSLDYNWGDSTADYLSSAFSKKLPADSYQKVIVNQDEHIAPTDVLVRWEMYLPDNNTPYLTDNEASLDMSDGTITLSIDTLKHVCAAKQKYNGNLSAQVIFPNGDTLSCDPDENNLRLQGI